MMTNSDNRAVASAGGALSDLCVVELAAFIAAPLAGMTLAQLGAEVIKIEPIGGSFDAGRWPLSPSGASLYWTALNKGKRSVAIDLRKKEGAELAAALIAAGGQGGGIFLTNLPARAPLDFDSLAARRPDVIMASILGSSDGSTAVDYTINCATGLPDVTGPASHEGPVNHVLPAWDVITAMSIVNAILVAERHRRATGAGQLVRMALSDVAFATMANLGFTPEAEIGGVRERIGNDLYGAFGRDFVLADGRRIMIVAITARQWEGLVAATGIADAVKAIEAARGLDLSDEGDRFRARDDIAPLIQAWCATHTLGAAKDILTKHGVCWGPYQTIRQLVTEDARFSERNPIFRRIHQPGIGDILAPGFPGRFSNLATPPQRPAPALGADTRAVLHTHLGLETREIDGLAKHGIIRVDAPGAGD